MKMDSKYKVRRFAVAVFAVTAVAASLSGCSKDPEFQDVTVELGTTNVTMADFLSEQTKVLRKPVTVDTHSVDFESVGKYPVTLTYGESETTVTLTIEDTTAPTVVFRDSCTVEAGKPMEAEQFVEQMDDLSPVTASFVTEPVIPEDYSDVTVTVQVVDESGNRTTGECRASFVWMKEELTWELGTDITKKDILFDAEGDDALLDQTVLDDINQAGIGTYTLISNSGEKSLECHISVQDTQGPVLEVVEAHTWPSEKVSVNTFVKSAEDPSGVASVELLTEINIREKGIHPVEIKAVDSLGNETLAKTQIKINLDHYDPVFEGLDEDLAVDKNGTPDYEAGIKVTDNIDGEIGFTYNADAVDLTTPGVYFVDYSATDAAGNVTSVRRRVVVRPDEGDVQALVEKVAADIPDDPKEIRNFVWKKIRYSASWGEPDALWHGFTKWSGNCYVHAVCLKAVFDAKGYETHLIWTKDKTHYWVMVNLEEGWRHMDATPSEQHVRILYMTDVQRKSTLDGRNWDRDAWPKAE